MAKIPWEIHQARFIASATQKCHFPQPSLPQVAFAGRSNVGKSSLLNMLVRMNRLARTSRTPGLTQHINFFLVNESFYFVDLPGYGYAKVPAPVQQSWQQMAESYLAGNPDLRLLILLVDARRGPSPLDDQLVDYARHLRIPATLVLTKCDKLGKQALAQARRMIATHYGLADGRLPIALSVLKNTGREELLQAIHTALSQSEKREIRASQ